MYEASMYGLLYPFVTRDESNYYCKSYTWDFQQDVTRRLEGALAEIKWSRLDYVLRSSAELFLIGTVGKPKDQKPECPVDRRKRVGGRQFDHRRYREARAFSEAR